MKKMLIASTVAVGFLGLTGAAWAVSKEGPPKPNAVYGPVYEWPAGEHNMHLQLIEDKDGGQWVIMSRQEAEILFNAKLDQHPFYKLN
jgi:hypothetical protein